jgi:hypothetical protein
MTLRQRLKIYYAPLPDESTNTSSEKGSSSSSTSSPPSSAAFEYCQRVSRLIRSSLEKEGDKNGQQEIKREEMLVGNIEPLPEDVSRLFEQETCNQKEEMDGAACNNTASASSENTATTTTSRTTTPTLHLFIISCAADGSVHRSVRKLARSLTAKQKGEKMALGHQDNSRNFSFALVLLGHARCDNSAKQMADTIYRAGRRFEKSLLLLLQVLQQEQTSITSPIISNMGRRCETQVELEGPEVKFDPWIMALAQSLLKNIVYH